MLLDYLTAVTHGKKVVEWRTLMVIACLPPDVPAPPHSHHFLALFDHSTGYNRAETLVDYKTGEEFIFMLVDLVSRGGNLLLNIGPSGLVRSSMDGPGRS